MNEPTSVNDINPLQGTIRNGQIVLDAPAMLPEGTRVEVLPLSTVPIASLGLREDQWPTTPEEIAGHLARMDLVEPGWLLAEDQAAWQAALREQREKEKAAFMKDADRLRDPWQ
jgi:hypothetical protein